MLDESPAPYLGGAFSCALVVWRAAMQGAPLAPSPGGAFGLASGACATYRAARSLVGGLAVLRKRSASPDDELGQLGIDRSPGKASKMLGAFAFPAPTTECPAVTSGVRGFDFMMGRYTRTSMPVGSQKGPRKCCIAGALYPSR